MLRMEPALPTLKIDPALPMLSTEPTLPMLSIEPALRMLPTLKKLRMLCGLFVRSRQAPASRIARRRAVFRCAFFPIRPPRARLLTSLAARLAVRALGGFETRPYGGWGVYVPAFMFGIFERLRVRRGRLRW